ncbi:hypothetical protein OXPF_18620 [Oxobacter pfennigii]|uniref:MucB/RseB N-terminal domain-containing protein n=1 Tax=Oxobacter pfennigii TaxID=36849 RepID=A0A0N8NTG6_9CLOT|nr:sigma-E factor regulatory protein RseB domain-containing protein [Oxobacter pfennigii]KPU44776.1 hypothetical protein OXPF_18620 [Oxobacter pfennigii]
MNDFEYKLSDYIDTLNAENKPKEHEEDVESPEMEKLYNTVRLIKTLKEPVMPEKSYTEKLVHNVSKQISQSKTNIWLKRLIGMTAAIAAMLVIALTLNYISPFNTLNYAYAMEKAYNKIKAYHGFIEIASVNAKGEPASQAKLEVWADKKGRYYVKQSDGSGDSIVTVNNGEKKWQVVPKDIAYNRDENIVYTFPAFPDSYRFSFELGKEIENIKNAISTEVIGEETVAGRKADLIEVTPEGGDVYKIWVDKETKLPLRKQSAMNNALQYTVTYTEIEFTDDIPGSIMEYIPSEGYSEVNVNQELKVINIEEAQNIAGFAAVLPQNIPEGYVQKGIAVETGENAVKIYYSLVSNEDIRIVLRQKLSADELVPSPNSMLGKIGDIQVEMQSPIQSESGILGTGPYAGVTNLNSIRWIQEGKEYAVLGNAPLETLAEFAGSLTGMEVEIPSQDGSSAKPQVEVPVDMEIAKNDQKGVDGGHSPWQLDPTFVTQVFVSLQISPEGITGDYPVKYEQLKIIENTGIEAIIEVESEKSPIAKVYLKRLVRQDETGIWSVVGYDMK